MNLIYFILFKMYTQKYVIEFGSNASICLIEISKAVAFTMFIISLTITIHLFIHIFYSIFKYYTSNQSNRTD